MGYTDGYTLFTAAKKGDVDKIQKCIEQCLKVGTIRFHFFAISMVTAVVFVVVFL